MADVEVIWTGWTELLDEFEGMVEDVPEAVDKIMAQIGKDALGVMGGYTPVDTGRLKSNNKMDTIEHGFTLSNETEYAAYVEYGTRKMAAQPYLAPAVEWASRTMDERLPEAFE